MSVATSGTDLMPTPGFRCAHPGYASNPLQRIIGGIVGIADLLAAIEGGPVVGRQRESFSETTRQVRIGDEDAAERDGVGMTGGNRRFRRLAGKAAGRDQDTAPD